MVDDTLMGINAELVELEREIGDSSDVVSSARERLLVAEHALEQAKAHALIASSGTVAERNAQVTIRCKDQTEAVDVARAEFEYARAYAMGLRDSLSCLQTRSANIRKEIDLAR